MASNLSTLIQEGLCNTINGLIAKKAQIQETSIATKEALSNINLVRVDSSFEFDKLTSSWNIYIPAYSASYIFNTMLGDSSEPSLEVDEDIADAMKEFISNYSGSLTTSINGENFEDLGQSKFVIGNTETLTGDNIENLNNMFEFLLDVEGTTLSIFIQFDESILPYLSDMITAAKENSIQNESKEQDTDQNNQEEKATQDEKEEAKEEKKEKEEENTQKTDKTEQPQKEEESLKNEPQEASNDSNEEKKEKKDDKTNSKQEEKSNNKKTQPKNKLKLIIIIIASLLVVTILAGVIMYFMGMFEPEQPAKKEPAKKTQTVKTKDGLSIQKYNEKKDINFKISQINKNRLNVRLEALTKYEILNEQQIQEQEAAQKERLYQLQKEQELMEFAAKNTEEDIFTKKENDPQRDVEVKTNFSDTKLENEQNKSTKQDTKLANNKIKSNQENSIDAVNNKAIKQLKFITVATLKYKLYNQLISKVTNQTARVSICKNSIGRTTIYIGPFSSQDDQSMMLELLTQENINGSQAIDITQDEFDTRCSFE